MLQKTKLPILLIITDNPSINSWLKKHLNKYFSLIDARSTEAIETLHYTPIDYIVIDSNIEGMDPIDICRAIRKVTVTAPILLITGKLKRVYLEEALDAGVTDFLNDSLSSEDLKERFLSMLKEKNL